jgi:hypothetical protein
MGNYGSSCNPSKIRPVADARQEMAGHQDDVRRMVELAHQRLEVVSCAGGAQDDDGPNGFDSGVIFVLWQAYEEPPCIEHPSQNNLSFSWPGVWAWRVSPVGWWAPDLSRCGGGSSNTSQGGRCVAGEQGCAASRGIR